MQRLLNKAKPHKSEHRHPASQSEPHAQQQVPAPLEKSSIKHVHMAEDSKENLPTADSAPQFEQQQQDRALFSSSLPLTPAFEGQVPTRIRRSSIPVSEDHHLQAFENSGPGRIALAIAPQVAEMKGTYTVYNRHVFVCLDRSKCIVCNQPSAYRRDYACTFCLNVVHMSWASE